jgi:chromosome segregation ATPase
VNVVLVLVSIALCVTLGILLFGSRRGSAPAPKFREQLEAEIQARSSAEAELDRRKKELEDHKAQLSESREQLKQAKRKLFEQKESQRDSRHLARAREDIERSASLQLESVRSELALAQAEIQRLEEGSDASRSRRTAPPAPEPPAPAAPIPQPVEKSARKFRELSDADRERMQRLEQQAGRERGRSLELEREVKRFRARAETQHRVYVVTKGELDLLKDKFKALEKRLNRTLLERDLIRRALQDLERKSGIAAERIELTAEEIAASDRTVEEKAAAAAAEAEKAAAEIKAQAEREERERDKAVAQADASAEVSVDHGAGNAS